MKKTYIAISFVAVIFSIAGVAIWILYGISINNLAEARSRERRMLYSSSIPGYVLNVFSAPDSDFNKNKVLNIGDALNVNLPNWIVSNWSSRTSDGDIYMFNSNDSIQEKYFSGIVIELKPTTELYNAEYTYTINKTTKSNLLIAEVLVNKNEDLRIYHIQSLSDDYIYDDFYIDGNDKTAHVKFSSHKDMPTLVSSKMRDFMLSFYLKNSDSEKGK